MKLSAPLLFATIVASSALTMANSAYAVSECPVSGPLSSWGTDSISYAAVPRTGCLFPIRISGVFQNSKISTQPQHGKLTRRNVSTYVYMPQPGFQGQDMFAIQATGKGPTGVSGTSVVTLNATVQ